MTGSVVKPLIWGLAVGHVALALASPTRAQETDSLEIERLKRQMDAVTRQLEELMLGRDVVVRADTSRWGFGPAASKVYRVQRGVSIGGYGEVLYENFESQRQDGSPSGKTDQLDALRAVVYVGYKFNDKFLFNSEIEVEHSATSQAGSVALEFAYVDYRFTNAAGIRSGLVLLPMGFVNEMHEPTTFLGTERPETEKQIIPSTWREVGIGAFGEASALSFRAYLVSGLDGAGGGTSKASGFSATGLRGGRQKGSKAVAEDFALVARVDYSVVRGLSLGTSAYYGGSGQNNVVGSPPQVIGAETFIWEGHSEYKAHGFDIRGLVALADVQDVALLNQFKSLENTESIGERLVGWYVQAGYDILRSINTSNQLIPFARYEHLNTQRRVPSGYASDPANDRRIITLGVSWKPISSFVTKAEYQFHSNQANTGINQFNLALGYVF
ncbi:MAG: hypothetical protein JSW51_03190 [Gemmatimonadota bacterium]|nr:MAG: hypothetical protein JSW51_03190 [Gemmatimonadota bacterium]